MKLSQHGQSSKLAALWRQGQASDSTASSSHPPIGLQLLDKANEATDRKLARHLVSLYGNGVGRLGNEVRQGGWLAADCVLHELLSFVLMMGRTSYRALCLLYPAKRRPAATVSRLAPRPHPPTPSSTPQADIIPMDTLRDYIAFSRATCFPQLQPEAANVSGSIVGMCCAYAWQCRAALHGGDAQVPGLLVACGANFCAQPSRSPPPIPSLPPLQALSQAYVEMRSMGMSRKIVSATPRQLESLIRLSGAWQGRGGGL